MSAPKLRYALLADDVRFEQTGKLILIGVYGDTVVSGSRPLLFSGTVQASFDPPSERGELALRLTLPNGEQNVSKVELPGDVAGEVKAQVNFQALLETEGQIMFQHQFGDDDWSAPIVWNVTFAPNAESVPADILSVARSAISRVREAAEGTASAS